MNRTIPLKHIEMWKPESQEIQLFTPRIPVHAATDGETETARICTAPSIPECCIAHESIPYVLFEMSGNSNLIEMSYEYFYHFLESAICGILVRVYHFQAEEDEVIDSETIQENNWVYDVERTKEHWITRPIRPYKVTYAIINGDDDNIRVLQESDTIEELGVFMRLDKLDSYYRSNRDESSVFETKLTKKDAMRFKEKVLLYFKNRKVEQEIKAVEVIDAISEPLPIESVTVHPLHTGDPNLPF